MCREKLNELWTKAMAKEMVRAGISYCCLGYGSRNTPLVLALSNEPAMQTYHHFDERGLAFHALGRALSNGKPVAVVVTSGSAVANLYPAIMEAFEEEIPLLLITADRPSALRSMGSNQTTDQVRIFSNHVVWQSDFPAPDSMESISQMSHQMSYCLSKLRYPISGPVHLNCMFREPLEYASDSLIGSSSVAEYFSPEQLTPFVYRNLRQKIPFHLPGIILVGKALNKRGQRAILALATRLQWPVFADVTSNMRGMRSDALIPFYDLLLGDIFEKKLLPSTILHFGGRLISKRLLSWIESLPDIFYIHVSSSCKNYNPIYRLTHRLYADPCRFCDRLSPLLDKHSSSSYRQMWIVASQRVRKKVDLFYKAHASINEIHLALYLSKLKGNYSLFLSNSMPIRDADMLFFPTNPVTIFANRGISGIDGNIATAIGMATSLQNPLIAVLGDLASLHDLNSLLQVNQSIPIIFIIINNGGGGIFSFLPIAQTTSKTTFDTGFAGKHTYCFSEFSKSLQLLYFSPNSILALEKSILEAQKKSIPAIIEIKTDREENYRLHAQFLRETRLTMAKYR